MPLHVSVFEGGGFDLPDVEAEMGVGVEFRLVKGFVADFLYPSELDFPGNSRVRESPFPDRMGDILPHNH